MGTYGAMLLLGLLAGVTSGIFGIGGGIIIIPVLLTFFKMPYRAATGTSLVALLLPVGILGVLEYLRNEYIQTQHVYFGLMIALGIFLGTYGGSYLASILPTIYLRKGFALLLVFAAVKTWMSS